MRHPATRRRAAVPRPARPAAAALAALALVAGCGGGGSSSNAPPVVGPGGGTVTAEGVTVIVPPGALLTDTTIEVTRDSTGAPPLPPAVQAAGAVFAITPHGGDFASHVEVVIPVEQRTFAANEQLVLITANPGDPGWRVLSAASFANGKLHAPVMSFSFYQAVVLVDLAVPQLVVSMNDMNNFGLDGARQIAPDEVLSFPRASGYADPNPIPNFVARLRYPAGRLATARLAGLATRPCLPANYDSSGAAFRFMRNGATWQPAVRSGRLPYTAASYPRTESEFDWTYLRKDLPRMSAYHFYGQDNPRIGGYGSEAVELAPPNNVIDDDLYTWRGVIPLDVTVNGRWRIDVSVPTDCGLSLQAAPLSFLLNLLSQSGGYVEPMSTPVTGVQGSDHRIWFWGRDSQLVRLEYSSSAQSWEGTPVTAQISLMDTSRDPYFRDERVYEVVLPNLQPSGAGFYRAYACALNRPAECSLGPPVELRVVLDQPRILQQPLASWIARVGDEVTFRQVRVETRLTPRIRWQKRNLVLATFGLADWEDLPPSQQLDIPVYEYGTLTSGFTTQLWVTASLADHLTQYRVVFDTAYWGMTSEPALLSVVEDLAPPQITAQPASQNVVVGSTAVLVATVSGSPPFSYQWRRNGTNVAGANAATLTLNNVTGANAGDYTLVVSNRVGTVTSDAAVLVVTLGTPVDLPPQITAPPVSLSVAEGNTASFAVSVSGTGPYTYQWYKDGQAIPAGADGPSYVIGAATSASAGQYAVRVTNVVASILSAAATLTVTPGTTPPQPTPPVIVTAPAGLAVSPGAGATFAVAVTGTAPFSFQWKRDGVNVDGATGSVLHIPSVSGSDAGQYTVEVMNAAGTAASAPVPLIVIGAPVITQQPTSQSIAEGGSATFGVVASGPSLLYQWTRDGVAIPGAVAASYTTPALALADSGAVFGVIVYNGAGLVFSQGATVTVSAVTRAWSSAALLESNDVGDATRPHIALNASGDGMAVWQHAHDNVRESIWASRYTAGAGWGAPVLIETDDTDVALTPRVAIDGAGNALAVWTSGSGVIWSNRYDAATASWGSAVALGNGTGGPKVVFDALGNAMAVWNRYSGGTVTIWADRYVAGTGWAGAAAIFDVGNSGGAPDVAFHGDGSDAWLVALHWNGVRTNVYAMRYRAATDAWGAPVLIESDDLGSTQAPQVAIDLSGHAVAVWVQFDGTRYDVRASHYAPGTDTWSTAPLSLTAAAGSGGGPQVGFDAFGNAVAVWAQADGPVYNIWSNRYTAGVGWGTAETIETGDAGDAASPQIAVDADGNAFATWYQSNGTFNDVWVNRYTAGTGWGTPALLETLAGQALRPQVAVDGNGNAMAIWDQPDGGRISIWASLYR